MLARGLLPAVFILGFLGMLQTAQGLEIRVVTDDSVASNRSDISFQIVILTIPFLDTTSVSYKGSAKLHYEETSHNLSIDSLQLQLSDVNVSFQVLLWPLSITLEDISVIPLYVGDATVNPADGSFTAEAQFLLRGFLTMQVGEDTIFDQFYVEASSDAMVLSGSLSPALGTAKNGQDRYKLVLRGPITYNKNILGIPLLGEVGLSIMGDLDLGFQGPPPRAFMNPIFMLLLSGG